MIQSDVVVVGAGPVGLFAIFECGMLGIQCHVVDPLETIGGQCIALYPEKPIYDIPGYPVIKARDLIDSLREQAAPFKPVYHLNQQVIKCEKNSTGYEIETSLGTTIETKAIIIAAGTGAFGPKRPPLPEIERYEGRSIFYLVKNPEEFRGKRVVIAGGGDSALDWALVLVEIAERVMVAHRRDKFRGAAANVAKLYQLHAQGQLDLVTPYQLAGLQGREGYLTGVRVARLDGKEERLLPADVLLPFFGLSMNLGAIAGWGLNLDRNRIVINQETSETSETGIFAVGDISYYPSKLKLILTGFAEAAQAAHAIYPLIFPTQELHFEYSTTKGLPQ